MKQPAIQFKFPKPSGLVQAFGVSMAASALALNIKPHEFREAFNHAVELYTNYIRENESAENEHE